MQLQKALANFLQSLEGTGRSPATIATYKWRLTILVKFLNQKGIECVEGVTPEILDCWAVAMHRATRYEKHPYRSPGGMLSPETINGRLRDARAWFRFCVRRGYIATSPADHLRPIRRRGRQVKAMTKKQLHRLISATTNARDKAIIMFLADTGCRAGEVCNLTIEETDLPNRCALVDGKTGPRRVYFTTETAAAVLEWLTHHPTGTGALFTTLSGPRFAQAITTDTLYLMLRRAARRAGVNRFNPHSIRHLVGQIWADQTNLELTRQKLGHQDIATTAIYANQDDSRLIAATDRLSLSKL
ncbi:MAG: hypothetical protein D6706_02115 [Chloroflexi bacterium]|nr:MAG: hypothetical protein D6706_02115 [Chloroflexota bacterium]